MEQDKQDKGKYTDLYNDTVHDESQGIAELAARDKPNNQRNVKIAPLFKYILHSILEASIVVAFNKKKLQ